MKYVIALCLLTLSLPSFSQSGTADQYKKQIKDDLRSYDLLKEQRAEDKKTIDSLNQQVKVVTVQKVLETQKVNSLTVENAAWKTKYQNLEQVWKSDRAKKRKKGWVNVLLTAAVGGLAYLYITK